MERSIKPIQQQQHHQIPSPTALKPLSKGTKASEAVPLPLYLTNGVFFTLFFSVVYYLLSRWREKIRNSTPLHLITLSEIAAIVAFVASFIYLLGFFGIGFVQSLFLRSSHDDVWGSDDDLDLQGRHSFRSLRCRTSSSSSFRCRLPFKTQGGGSSF